MAAPSRPAAPAAAPASRALGDELRDAALATDPRVRYVAPVAAWLADDYARDLGRATGAALRDPVVLLAAPFRADPALWARVRDELAAARDEAGATDAALAIACHRARRATCAVVALGELQHGVIMLAASAAGQGGAAP